jgi:hypothetical protein
MGYPSIPYLSLPGFNAVITTIIEPISIEIEADPIDLAVEITEIIDVLIEVI